jgi:putative addiction module killer protein
MYRIRKYRDTNGRVPFEEWMNTIVDRTTKVRLLKRLDKVQLGNLGDWSAVGGGVNELREHFGQGFRIYYGMENREIILLLCGGDKSSQASDINKAKRYWQEYNHARD